MTPSDAMKLLNEYTLPSDVTFEVEDDPQFAGRYFPRTDVLRLGVKADKFTVLHEGAHAEHWEKLGVRKSTEDNVLGFVVGGLLASEVYVGRRLAAVEGYREHEWAALKRITRFLERFVDLAACFDTAQNFGPPGEASFLHVQGMKWVMVTLPFLGLEVESGSIRFFAGMVESETYPGLMSTVAKRLAELPAESLVDRTAVAELGGSILGVLADAGFEINSAV